MLEDYKRIRDKAPAVIVPLMKAYYNRIDDALEPGLNALSWASITVDNCECTLPSRY